ncbi:MAG: hypothetical protein RML40_12210, partial [Bacteroidota bacterium]|nr:hypothetical protein [Candidatus Kapabacteria bacterium]MDW8221279.1 hypothetical protein [Bacteroidota bacterium]
MNVPHDIEILLHKLLTERRLTRRMALARALSQAMKHRTTPIIRGTRAIFLWEGSSKHVGIIGDWTQWRYHVPMRRVRCTSWFYHSQEFPYDARLQYKFVLDDTFWQNDPRNPRVSHEGFGTNSEFYMPGYKDE